jgi:hypothetical protein
MAIEIESIQQRVKDSGLFTQVKDVLSLADAINNPGANLQTAFVAIPKETAEPSRTMGVHRQRITAKVGVTFALQAQTNTTGRAGVVEAMRSTMKNFLAGFLPDGAETPLDYSYSEITSISRGFIWVSLFFETKYIFTPDAA